MCIRVLKFWSDFFFSLLNRSRHIFYDFHIFARNMQRCTPRHVDPCTGNCAKSKKKGIMRLKFPGFSQKDHVQDLIYLRFMITLVTNIRELGPYWTTGLDLFELYYNIRPLNKKKKNKNNQYKGAWPPTRRYSPLN